MMSIFDRLSDAPISQEWTERIVRLLGCNCPSEIFDSITRVDLSEHDPELVLAIGGRLLVALVPATRLGQAASLLQRGRDRRDALGLHRFRLVLVGEVPPEHLAPLEAIACDLDERVHVHALPESALHG